jgi:serine/threonine-protein kinase
MPIKKEAYRGYHRVMDLARIYTMVGEYKKAIDQIEYLLSIPGPLSTELLRIDPKWDPLRKNPRFKKIIKEGKQYSYIANDK